MRHHHEPGVFWATLAFVLVLTVPTPSAYGLTVLLDSGAGSIFLTDDDLDGVIDFNTTVGGVFQASGRVFEQVRSDKTIVSITSTPPTAESLVRNIGGVDATFTILVDSSAFPVIGPPLGWSVFYSGRTADAMGGAVNVTSHSVQAATNAGAVLLTTLAGPPSVAAENFSLSTSGANAADSGTDMRVIYSFTLAPGDEIHLPDNNDTDGDAIQVSMFNQQQKCVDKMNVFAHKLLNAAQKSDSQCINTGLHAGGADETVCVDDTEELKTAKAETKFLDGYASFCAASLPPWGVNGDKCCEGGASDGASCLVDAGCPSGACLRGACASSATELAANDLTHDLFGASVVVTDGSAIGKCQRDITKLAGKLIVERWKVFRSCKKDNFPTILDDASLVSTCLTSPQPDAKDKISKLQNKLVAGIDKCILNGVTPLAPAFPGECIGAVDSTMTACISDRASCRFCLAVNVADAISPAVDCDLFDDAMANLSCP